jgi:hypothetical protein
MSEQQRPTTYQIPTRMPEFVEDSENTNYANVVNVGFDGNDFCVTFLRRPRPLALDVEAIKAGQVQLEMNPVSRVYLPIEVARGLCQALSQNLAALDRGQPRPGRNGTSPH